ncbi:MAG TPA: hypothetical protein VFL57_02620 [Bryobacteraceae bacterium]|nr:hypothetical protein [Bryobacteraceae bacterium]
MNEETQNGPATGTEKSVPDVRSVIREALQEFMSMEQAKAEPAYKTELAEERRRREQLEQRLNELVQENRRNREIAETAERSAAIRGELQRLGVTKVDLAFRAVKDDIHRAADGTLIGRGPTGELALRDFLTQFVSENPELLPARIPGGSGVAAPQRSTQASSVDLDRIKPGMTAEELARVRAEIARVAAQAGVA